MTELSVLEPFLAGARAEAEVFLLRPDHRAVLPAVDGPVPGLRDAAGHITLGVLAAAAGLALLLPVLPFALEMLALRRMAPAAFGTLMALEPAGNHAALDPVG